MKILAAVDLYAQPERLLDALTPWAARLGARVDLTFASPFDPDDPTLRDAGDRLKLEARRWRDVQREEHARLQALTERLPASTRGTPRLLRGRALDVLPDATSDYDLAIVGTHGYTGATRLFLGSVAERMVRLAKCAVLVLRPHGTVRPLRPDLTVVAPLEVPPGGEAIRVTRQLLGDAIALHVVHVFHPGPLGPPDPVLEPDERAALKQVATDHGYPSAAVHVARGTGSNVGADVVAVATQLDADLIALPTHGRTGLARLALGSVTERVVRLAECPVLVTRR